MDAATKIKQVPVDKETTLSIKVEGAKEGDPVTFSIKKQADDSEVDTVDGTIKKGKAVAKWTAKGPEPDGDERSWRVYFTAEAAGNTATSEEMEVYLDKLEVTSVGEDGAALKDRKFTILVGPDGKLGKKEGHTGSSGTTTVDNIPPGDLEVRWRAPSRLVAEEEKKAGKLKAKLKPAPVAKLLFPEPVSGGAIQYVNHAPHPDHPEWGHKIKVRVGVEDEDGPTRKGDQIFLKAKWPEKEKLSKRNVPARALVGGKKLPWSDPEVGRVVTIKEDGGEAVFELELGYAGGDEVTIYVGGTDSCEDADCTIANWRKIYYQVTHRSTLAKLPDLTRLTETLAELNVEYEPYGTKTFSEGDAGVPPGTFFDGAVLDRPGERLVCIGDHNKKWFHTKLFDDSKKPLGVHVLLCDFQLDGGIPAVTDLHTPVMTTPTLELTTSATNRFPFPVALQDGKSPIVSGSWRSTAPAGHPDAGKQGKLVDANVALSPKGRKIKISLPGDAAAIVGDGSGDKKDPATKHKVKVVLKIKVVIGVFLGESDGTKGNWQLIASIAEDSMNDVMAHELGHTMNQCVQNKQAPPPGLKAKDHDRRYVKHGHQGPHCAEGMSATDFAKDDYRSNDACKCIMYGENRSSGGSRSNGKFCDKCKPFVIAERLTTM
jgi:hypothetical protein